MIRLDSLLNQGAMEIKSSMFKEPSMSRADSLSDRDLMEYLKLQTMQRGAKATREGMSNNPQGLFK